MKKPELAKEEIAQPQSDAPHDGQTPGSEPRSYVQPQFQQKKAPARMLGLCSADHFVLDLETWTAGVGMGA
jgi:hypothetical protein